MLHLERVVRRLRLDVDDRMVSPIQREHIEARTEHDLVPLPTERRLEEAPEEPPPKGTLTALAGQSAESMESLVACQHSAQPCEEVLVAPAAFWLHSSASLTSGQAVFRAVFAPPGERVRPAIAAGGISPSES